MSKLIEALKLKISAERIIDKIQDIALNSPDELSKSEGTAMKLKLDACKALLDKVVPTVKSQEIKDAVRNKFEDYLDLVTDEKKPE